ncbi:MAG: TIGR00374 family protein, partial [Solirubrobacteraceae bacterium]
MSALPHSSKVAARPSSGTADGLGARQVSRRLLETAGAALLVLALVLAVPGLGKLRAHLSHAAPGWVAVGVALELLSALSYVVIFRSVFCARMGW